MDNQTAAVEILMPVWNGERHLREQLDSIISQTWPSWHLTISDDNSSDTTLDIVHEYIARYPQRMTRVYHNTTFGNARDHYFWLMSQCQSLYLMFCDQDDVWLSDKVEKTMRALLAQETVCGSVTPILAFTDVTPVNEQLKPLATSMMQYQMQNPDTASDFRSLLFQNVVSGCSMAINRSLAEKAMVCIDQKGTIMHDWWLATVAACFGRTVYVPESTLLYRQHNGNTVGAKAIQKLTTRLSGLMHLREERKQIIRKKHQAFIFYQTYQECLTPNENIFLQIYSKSHSGPIFYWKHRNRIYGTVRWLRFIVLG